MVKLVFLCRRKPGLTHERYVERLLDGHVPLALRHHPTLRKYVVNVVEAAPPHAALDSIGELSFDTLADFRDRLYDSPAGRRAIEADAAAFLGRVDAYVVEEQVVLRGPHPSVLGSRSRVVKIMICLRRAGTVDAETFLARWRAHPPGGLGDEASLAGYVRDVVTDRLSAQAPAWDGIETRYLPPDGGRTAPIAEEPFIGEILAYRVAEYVQKLP